MSAATAAKHVTSAGSRIARGVGRLSELVLERGEGTWMHTACKRKLLDMTCGIGVTNTGHCHPAVVAAAQEQCAKLIHGQVNLGYTTPMLDLVDELSQLMPHSDLDCFFMTTTGAEAVENAIKLARYSTGRQNVVCFQGGYHGRTQQTMALTTSSVIYRQKFGPFPPGVLVAPFPYELHGKHSAECLEELRLMLKTQCLPEEVACMVIEPVLGEGGYVPVPQEFAAGLRQICNEYGILLILDEVQTGFGRTGKLFASEYYLPEAPADILVMAKGLASGFPLAAIASRTELMDTQAPGTMGGTYAANPISCAAAIATQRAIRDEGMVQNAAVQGSRLRDGLRDIAGRHSAIRDVRGLGCMVGVELQADVPASSNKRVAQACLARGMLLLPASVHECLRFIPPLNVSPNEVDLAVEMFEKALCDTGL